MLKRAEEEMTENRKENKTDQIDIAANSTVVEPAVLRSDEEERAIAEEASAICETKIMEESNKVNASPNASAKGGKIIMVQTITMVYHPKENVHNGLD